MEILTHLKNWILTGNVPPMPKGWETVLEHPVMTKSGDVGVLLRNTSTGLYSLYIGGREYHFSSVDQEEARQIAELNK